MTIKVFPSRVAIVSGVWMLSITLTGEDEYSISDLSSRDRFDGIHHAFASSARLNSVSSSVITNAPSPGWDGTSYRNPTPSLKARQTTSNLRAGAFDSTTETLSSLWLSRTRATSPHGWVQVSS